MSLPIPPRAAFVRLAEIEPKLYELEERIKAIRRTTRRHKSFCANRYWYGNARDHGIKEDMCDLVGWDASRRALRTEQAYDTAYEYLYSRLPDCRHCGCPVLPC